MPAALTPAAAAPRYRRIAVLCGSVVAAIGALVLAGWWLDLSALKLPPPGNVAMKANTALAFLLAGAALVLHVGAAAAGWRAPAARALALLVALIGGLTLCQYAFGWQLGIDELLFKDVTAPDAPSGPGRMAPNTAVAFVLVGLALIGIEWEPNPGLRPAEWLALASGLMTLVALGEYAVGQPVFYGFAEYTRMALLTAVNFLVLSVGVVLARPGLGVLAALRERRLGVLEPAVYAALVLAITVVAAGGAWYHRTQEQQARRDVVTELEVIGRLKVEQIAQWRAERHADGTALMRSGFFAEGVWRWLSAPRPEFEADIRGALDALLEGKRYQEAVLVDNRGDVLLASSRQASILHAEERQTLASALRERRPVMSDLHTGPLAPMPHANLVVPLWRQAAKEDAAGEARAGGAPFGAVVLRIDAQAFLYPLIQSWPTASPSAETLLVRLDGDDVLFINDIRHQPGAALKLRIPLRRTEVPAVRAVLGTEGVFEGRDYRGVKVLSVVRAIPDTPWFMVAKVDEAEALAAWRAHAALILTVIVALTLALAAAAALVWQQKNRYRAFASAAAALRESEERFRSAMESSIDGMAVVAPDGRWIEVNDALCEFLGRCRRELLAANFQTVTHPDDLAADLQQVRAMRDGSIKSYRTERRYLHKSGRTVWAQVGVSLVRDADGRVRNFVAHVQDITERKRTEVALELERSKLAAAFENVDIGLVICDAQGGDITMNAAALRYHGFSSAEDMLRRVGEYAEVWELHHPDGRSMPYDEWPLLRTIRGDYVRDYEACLHNVKTGLRWVGSYTSAPVRNAAGEVILLVMTLIDITVRKRAEQQILEINATLEQRVAERTQQLEEASRAKTDFLANMSHELRTPLNSIIGFSEMLKDGVLGELDARQCGYVDDIFSAGTHLLALINDILDLSKVEAGMVELDASAVDVEPLLQASLQVVRGKAAANGIRLEIEIEPALGLLHADERKLKQVVYNLLSNAVKFTPEGGTVTLSARRCSRAEVGFDDAMPARLIALPPGDDTEFLAIEVEDGGVGIAAKDLARLFEPFTQVDSSIARRHAGTGLGLSLVRRLAELHGGTAGVASRVGVGSRFRVWLPWRDAASQAPAAPTSRR